MSNKEITQIVPNVHIFSNETFLLLTETIPKTLKDISNTFEKLTPEQRAMVNEIFFNNRPALERDDRIAMSKARMIELMQEISYDAGTIDVRKELNELQEIIESL